MNATTVINVRARDRSQLLARPDFVYVGRAVGRAGWSHSMWRNPFRVIEGTLNMRLPSQVVWHFEELLDRAIAGRPEKILDPAHRRLFVAMAERLPELRGKVLGCWCCDWNGLGEPWQPCHAVVLAKLADGPHGDPR